MKLKPLAAKTAAALQHVELEHHYGWRTYEIEADTVAEAAYLALRKTHTFLTDENHTYQCGLKSFRCRDETVEFLSISIYKTDASPKFYLAPARLDDGPGAYWFGVKYREAAQINPRTV